MGNMLQHPEDYYKYRQWLKCVTCNYCCKENDLVQYYKEEEATRVKPISEPVDRESERTRNSDTTEE